MINSTEETMFHAKNLSDVLNIPYKFLAKIMTELTKAQLILSIRGRDGGYKLVKNSSSITIMDILNEFNEPIYKEECILGIGLCDESNKCSMHDQWVKPKALLLNMFANTTLKNLEGSGFKI